MSRRLVVLGRLVKEDRLTTGAVGDVFCVPFFVLLTTFSFEPNELDAMLRDFALPATPSPQGSSPVILSILLGVFLA